jgi:hypothetical protein
MISVIFFYCLNGKGGGVMEDDTEEQKQTTAPKKSMSDFRKALIITALACFFTGVGLVAAIGALVYFAVKGKRQIAAGVAVGMAIAIVAWGLTCFAIMATTM